MVNKCGVQKTSQGNCECSPQLTVRDCQEQEYMITGLVTLKSKPGDNNTIFSCPVPEKNVGSINIINFFFLYLHISRFSLGFQKPRQECWQCHKVLFFFCLAQIKMLWKIVLFILQSKIASRIIYFWKWQKFSSSESGRSSRRSTQKFWQCTRAHFSRARSVGHEDKQNMYRCTYWEHAVKIN